MYTVVLIRHGQSIWNQENRFTGWEDVGLSEEGKKEASKAGSLLLEKKFSFDIAYSSVLQRTIQTLWILLENLKQMYIPVTKAWQLNERHYGMLQGLNKKEIVREYGEEQVHMWRRSFRTAPPRLKTKQETNIPYKKLGIKTIPKTESLEDTMDRVVPYWEKTILPNLLEGKKILISAHGNSLRSLCKHLENIPDEKISELNIPTATPLVYNLDKKLNVIKHYYL